MQSVEAVFERYENVRHRMPQAKVAHQSTVIASLLDIADRADAFVFDAFGVLNVGDTPIEGAATRLDQLRERGAAIRILTNAASYDRTGAIAKFASLGMSVADEEIITSRDAALSAVPKGLLGCIALPEDKLADIPNQCVKLVDDAAEYAKVDAFLFLSSQNWNDHRQSLLLKALQERPRPLLIANADLVAPRDSGLSLEPGHYGHLIADRGVVDVQFFGKPFSDVYDLVEATLPDIAPNRIVMCGDTLHTDILGAAYRGWQTAFITQDGLFSGFDVRKFVEDSKLTPTWEMSRI